MRRRRRQFLFAAVTVAVAIAVVALRPARRAASPSRVAWSTGERLVYDLDASTRARVVMSGDQALEGVIAVAGRVELRAYGVRGDAALVELVLAPSTIRLEVGGVDALDGDAAGELGDTRAWLEIAADGDVGAVAFAPGARPAWKDLAAQLVGWLEVVTADRATWTVAQVGPFGTAAVNYVRTGGTLTRTRTEYAALDAVPGDVTGLRQTVDGHGAIELAGGHLRRLDERETVSVRRGDVAVLDGEAHLTLQLIEVHRAQVAAPATLGERRRPGDRIASHDRDALLAQRVGDLTPAGALADLAALADIGMPDAGEWLWRATALVRLHPELCEQLRALAVSGRLRDPGIALVADLLAAAGTDAAQAALRAIVVEAPAGAANARVALVQRLSRLETPHRDTIALARLLRDQAQDGGDVDGARAAAYVVGNLAATVRGGGDAEAAAALVAPLVLDLARARGTDERVALAVAVGTAGLAEHETLLAGLARDGDAAVRRAAVIGLLRQPGADARDALIDLSSDRDGGVRSAALRALAERDLDDDAIGRLATALAGGVDRHAQGDLVRLLIAQTQRGADLERLGPAIDATLALGSDPATAEALRRAR